MFPTRFAIALLLGGLACAGLPAQTSDPFVGTWKLNVAKSKTTFKSATTVVESAGEGIKTTAAMVRGDGTSDSFTWTAKYDGRDTPVIGASPYGSGAHSIALTRIDSHTATIVTKLDGKVTITQTLVVSVDGQTRTIHTTGTDDQGQPVSTTAVYEKQ
ncbi:MAG: hypothetical protein JWO56_3264 [Acidobacteria bacterium]|nr:hypothetical protein [Acidobacteriota bacterium]